MSQVIVKTCRIIADRLSGYKNSCDVNGNFMTLASEPATMKVEEAARILGIGRQTAYDLAARGELPGALRLGRRWVVRDCHEIISSIEQRNAG